MSGAGEGDTARVPAEWAQTIAHRWHEAVGGSGLGGVAVPGQLDRLAGETVALLGSGAPLEQATRDIGGRLAGMQEVTPEAFGGVLQALVEELADGRLATHRDGVGRVVRGIAAGFVRRRQEMALAEQHAIHQALARARRQAQKELRVSEERYRAVVRHAAEGIVLADARSGRILEASPSFQRLLGYSADELAGDRWLTSWPVTAAASSATSTARCGTGTRTSRSVAAAARMGRWSRSRLR